MDTIASLEAVWRNHLADREALFATLPPGGAGAQSDDQRAAVRANMAKVEVAYREYEKSLPPPPPEPEEADLLEQFLQRRQWERELDVPADDIVPIEARLAVPFSAETAESLIRHMRRKMKWITADSIGWDLRRLLGDESGLDQYDIARWILDEDQDEEAPARLWPVFDRARQPQDDRLLIDIADEALHGGWDAPADIVAAVEQLRDIAKGSPIRLEAAENVAIVVNRQREKDKWHKEQRSLRAAALTEWRAFGGKCTQQQLDSFHVKFAKLTLWTMDFEPLTIVPPPMPLADHPYLTAPQADSLVKFWAHLPSGKMIYEGTRELWSPGSLDKHIGRVKDAMATGPGTLATTWLSQHRAVQSMGWAPGEPMIVEDKVLTKEGWLRSQGDRTFNIYVPPDVEHIEGDVSKWLEHIKFIYPQEAEHIVRWLAHRAQYPGRKVNHCLDFIGHQGIGKDTILAPVITAIGSQNFKQITAKIFYNSEWNDFLQSVILRINEVHDLGGESRYGFYDATKDVITNPPETHRINSKHTPQYAAMNVCGVIMTSNHLDALYIHPDDRRHFVCVSTRTKEEFPPGYFDKMHVWFNSGGNEAVAHYLANLDLGGFNAMATPPKTEGWHMVVAAGLAPESGDLSDVIEAMGKPPALTLPMIRSRTPSDSQLRLAFEDAKLRRAIPKRLAECGYINVANPDARESGGRWRTLSGRIAIYARQELSENERLLAARSLNASVPLPPPA